MERKLVSVIVPVYNKEIYIDNCIESIVNQTYKNIEIIILNDGSKDYSKQKIKSWEEKDSRLIYLEHSNIGLGPTRNRGVEFASGEYIVFVDADDTIESNMVEEMINTVFDEEDVIVCETFICEEKEKRIRKKLKKEIIQVTKNNIQNFLKSHYYKNIYSHNAWDKMYKRSFIKKNNIKFGNNEEIFAEDTYFSLQILVNNPVVIFLDKPLYNYYVREDSIMNSYKPNLIDRNINLLNYAVKLFEDNHINPNYLYLEWLNVIILEVNNILDSKSNFSTFHKSMKKFRNSSLLSKKRIKLKNKIIMIAMENNVYKRTIHYTATILLFLKLNVLADALYYNIYKIFKGSNRNEK